MTKVTQLHLNEEGGLGRRRIHLREISGDSESPLETVGLNLRAARLRLGDDLATVSKALKIRKDYLEAVEEDDLSRLPGKTYAIGFVRTYSAYLGLDAREMVERFKQEISGRQEEQAASDLALEDERKLPQGWRIMAGVVVLFLAYGAWHLMSAGPTAQPVPPPPALTPQKVAQASKPAAALATAGEAVPSPAIDKVPASDAPPVPAATLPARPANSIAAAATEGTATPTPAVPAVSPASPSAQVYGAQNRPRARVLLRARGDTHVVVRGQDGTVYLNRTLKAGDVYYVRNEQGLTLATTNAGAVEMVVDGRRQGVAGADQEVAGAIDLDPQAILDRAR
jgi:cytoskeleton protein RodZ